MATGDLYTYLNTATADYTATQLAVTPKQVMRVRPRKNQRLFVFDDESDQTLKYGSGAIYVSLIFDPLSDDDFGTLFDFWQDESKADGMYRTFEWVSPGVRPAAGYTYIAKFVNDEIEALSKYIKGIAEVTLKLKGYKA